MRGVVFTGPMKTIPRLRLAPAPSRWVMIACVVMGALSVGLMWMLSMPAWALACALGWCVVMTLAAIHSALRRVPSSIVLGANRRVAITDRSGVTREGDVSDSTYVGGWFIALVWRVDGARWLCAYLVPPGVLTAEERRQLRVLLRYGWPAGDDEDEPTPRVMERSSEVALG